MTGLGCKRISNSLYKYIYTYWSTELETRLLR